MTRKQIYRGIFNLSRNVLFGLQPIFRISNPHCPPRAMINCSDKSMRLSSVSDSTFLETLGKNKARKMSSLSRELVFLILQFLEEEKFKDSVHKLEQESGLFFNMKYFEEKVHAGEWDDADKYLSGFTKVDDNRYSMKIFFEIRKHKYLEALDNLNWQHQPCKNPWPNPDIKTLFIDHTCNAPNEALEPAPVNLPMASDAKPYSVMQIDANAGGVNDVAFAHPNKQRCVVTWGDDKLIKVWDSTGRNLYNFDSHESPVYSICPHQKENIQFIFSTAVDGKIKAWVYDNMGSRVNNDHVEHCWRILKDSPKWNDHVLIRNTVKESKKLSNTQSQKIDFDDTGITPPSASPVSCHTTAVDVISLDEAHHEVRKEGRKKSKAKRKSEAQDDDSVLKSINESLKEAIRIEKEKLEARKRRIEQKELHDERKIMSMSLVGLTPVQVAY